jgi:hypothetical protein
MEIGMKPSRLTLGLALAALLIGASVSESAFAQHGHGHGHGRLGLSLGFHFGGPGYWGPWPYYGYPAYYPYYPAPVVVQSPPQIYVERNEPATAAPEAGYWYYCAATRGYYPYVKECPAGWQKVAPTPQN